MDQDTQNYLDSILAKEPTGLTAADIEFLRARQDYLTEEQRANFANVLSSSDADPAPKAKKKADPAE